ncbi:helix-turn-helix transcriptional regulator [Paenibacillus larvae]
MKYTITQARLISGMSKVEVAAKLGMSEKTYNNYEQYNKVFRMDTAVQFVRLVKLKMEDIIFFQPKVQKICSSKTA